MFLGLSALKEPLAFEHKAHGNWKDDHITSYTLYVMDITLLQTLQSGPTASVIQRFHCTIITIIV